MTASCFSGFAVMERPCRTCIYRKDSPLDLAKLEADVADPYGGFSGHRVCHHSRARRPACCRGFWNAHKDEFAMGQIAQRLGLVEFVRDDVRPAPAETEGRDDG